MILSVKRAGGRERGRGGSGERGWEGDGGRERCWAREVWKEDWTRNEQREKRDQRCWTRVGQERKEIRGVG